MPDWTWILVVVGVLALAVVVARTVIGLGPRDEAAVSATAVHQGTEPAPSGSATSSDEAPDDATASTTSAD
ncbi:hypothetical protein [Georgenia sp. Z1491]|uniref:hypothetical protein n=1 Tax=Georgenia sp. Z1491 TaxID=3416707 RepID=UPI003CF11358